MRILAALALVLVAGCAEPSTATTSDVRPAGDALYLGALHRGGHPDMDDPDVRESTLRVGRAVCEVISLGDSPHDAYLLMVDSGSSPAMANLIVENAATHLCPDNTFPDL